MNIEAGRTGTILSLDSMYLEAHSFQFQKGKDLLVAFCCTDVSGFSNNTSLTEVTNEAEQVWTCTLHWQEF